MRVRLRPAYSREELAALYPVPHDHTRWPDHVDRVEQTIAFARRLGVPPVVADLSCGDAAIGKALIPDASRGRLILGDLAPGYELTGPIEETIALVKGRVGLWLLCETAEHLDDPDAVLRQIRACADSLILSTPIGETTPGNPEHYWGWDHDGVRGMLEGAGWQPQAQADTSHPLAQFQLWGCR